MAANDLLVLPSDVLIIPVTALSADVRDQLQCEDSDFAISRPRSRTRSSVIDSTAAEFLEEFRTPKTIIEAVLHYGRAKQVDPNQVLKDAFPLLERLRNARLLAPADSEAAHLIEPTFEAGSAIADFDVVRCVQVLEDTEVYQARNADGELLALKIIRQSARRDVAAAFDREAVILSRLDGAINPALRAQGSHEGRRYLALEWCPGAPAATVADELRLSADGDSALQLLKLCCSILDAYARLHQQHVIHADVHPRNILVQADGSVKLIDFGLARFEKPADGFREPKRAGIGYYFEPEYAQAHRLGKRRRAASMLGEQYALGALLYYVLTGAHYLDFALEKEEWLRQIAEDEPLPFSRRGVGPWPEVESVLARALSKDPADRFPSVEEFARCLRAAGIASRRGQLGSYARPIGEAVLQTVLQRLGTSGDLLASGLPLAPTCSVNYGASGIAYMFYRVACLQADPQLLAVADLWSNQSRRTSGSSSAFQNSEIGITPDRVGPVSLYHTPSGMHCVQALISQALGDMASIRVALENFVSASQHPCQNLDLTLGRSSTLVGCATLFEALPDHAYVDETRLLDLGNQVLCGIWAQVDNYAPIPECKEPLWLGIAHGWAGILYATMRWCQATAGVLPDSVGERLQQLAELAQPTGRGVCWRQSLGHGPTDHKAWAGWCHGSAGYVHLWLLAHQMYHDEAFLHLAEKAAWHSWDDAHGTGAGSSSLCCGYAGQAYALLKLYKYIGDAAWLERARDLGERAAATVGMSWLRSNSLYKGDVGIALLAADLAQPEASCMPLFEAEGWPASYERRLE